MAGPRTKAKRSPKAPVFVPHPDDAAHVREAFAEAERGETISLTPQELKHWADTGELPERVEKWADERSAPPRGR